MADFDTSGQQFGSYIFPDISILSHEIGEWINDPDNINPTPAWSSQSQATGACSNTYEVGDGLTGFVFQVGPMANGWTYNPQELVFFSWFYDQEPSIGAGGWYSDQGTFTTDAGGLCTGAINKFVKSSLGTKKP